MGTSFVFDIQYRNHQLSNHTGTRPTEPGCAISLHVSGTPGRAENLQPLYWDSVEKMLVKLTAVLSRSGSSYSR